jgi:LPS sulfotransferase NodH
MINEECILSDQPIQSYVICTTPRSGSTMLCKLLAATKIAGNPGSHFHEPSLSAWLGYNDLQSSSFSSDEEALAAVFAAAYKVGKGETNMFGLRLQRDSFAFFTDQLKLLHPSFASDQERMEAVFGKTQFIYLKREDHLDQAISRLRAQQTGLWHLKSDGSDLERKEPEHSGGYERHKIEAYAQQSITQNEEWTRWFAAESIAPLVITYSELSRNPQAALSRVLFHIGLNKSVANTVPVQTRKLADETNLAWRARYIAETAAGV